jgi:hypothetical protein
MRSGTGRARSQTQEIGLAGKISDAVMLLDVPCFPHHRPQDAITLLRSGRNRRIRGRKFEKDGKMFKRY